MKYYTRKNTILTDSQSNPHIVPQGTHCTILDEGDVTNIVKVTLANGKTISGLVERKDIAIDCAS